MQEEKDTSEHKVLPEEQVYDMMPINDIPCKYSDSRPSVVNVIIQVLMLVKLFLLSRYPPFSRLLSFPSLLRYDAFIAVIGLAVRWCLYYYSVGSRH